MSKKKQAMKIRIDVSYPVNASDLASISAAAAFVEKVKALIIESGGVNVEISSALGRMEAPAE